MHYTANNTHRTETDFFIHPSVLPVEKETQKNRSQDQTTKNPQPRPL